MSRRFDRILENATDQSLIEPDWEHILECVDAIRGGDVAVKSALQSIQKRYHSENPHVAHHALLVLEACVKNCGKKFHAEIATKEFMEDLKNLVIENAPDKVKNKVLELIQCWSSAFEKYPEYKIVCDTLSFMKMYGYEFPKLKEADAMFMADSAPDWAEGDNCFRCRVDFGIFTRKHHCRSCGQVFCDKCSSRQMILPHIGIEKKVRVCETCFNKNFKELGKPVEKALQRNGEQNGANSNAEEEARQRELQEQEELQLALAISQSEAEAKEQERQRGGGLYGRKELNHTASIFGENPKVDSAPSTSEYTLSYRGVPSEAEDDEIDAADDEIDAALSRYLNKGYWEKRHAAREAASNITMSSGMEIKASAPPPSEMSFSSGGPTASEFASMSQYPNLNGTASLRASASATPNGIAATYNDLPIDGSNIFLDQGILDLTNTTKQQKLQQQQQLLVNEVEQTKAFCDELREQVDTMNNRMRSNLLRGRPIINDSAIHSLFARLTAKHEEVLSRMSDLDAQREHFEGLQDRLAHIQETRQALNALREEHENQRRARLEEENRIRQQQIMLKLEAVRQQKHNMLFQERQAALQRFQQQEFQMQQRRVSPQMFPQQPQGMPPQSIGQQQSPMPQPSVQSMGGHMPQHLQQQQHIPQQMPSQQPMQQQYAPQMPPMSQHQSMINAMQAMQLQQMHQQQHQQQQHPMMARSPAMFSHPQQFAPPAPSLQQHHQHRQQQQQPAQDFDLLNFLGTNAPMSQPMHVPGPPPPSVQQANLIDLFDTPAPTSQNSGVSEGR